MGQNCFVEVGIHGPQPSSYQVVSNATTEDLYPMNALENTRLSLCDLPRVDQGVHEGVHSMAQTYRNSLCILVLQKRLSRAI